MIPGTLAAVGLVFTLGGSANADGSPERLASEAPKVAQPIREAVAAIGARIRGGATPIELRAISTDLVHVNEAGEIQVYVILTEFRPEFVAQLTTAGLRVELALRSSRLVQGWVPADRIDRIAGFDFVTEVKPPGYPVPRHG